ncbi:MAG: hypothetical protein F6K47_26225 [Symploca sp. SIO2E6]|nr:hypothetical protein [Symploca sp. SIO2E6]
MNLQVSQASLPTGGRRLRERDAGTRGRTREGSSCMVVKIFFIGTAFCPRALLQPKCNYSTEFDIILSYLLLVTCYLLLVTCYLFSLALVRY